MKQERTKVYLGTHTMDDWNIHIASTDQGVCYIGSPNQSRDEVETWIQKNISSPYLIVSQANQQSVVNELQAYLQGEQEHFTSTLDIIGTAFQQDVWQACQLIPYGETRSYSQIAEAIQRPKAVRAVGTAIGANPLLFIIPCHRIIAKDGGLAGFRAGKDVKKYLLALERK